MISTQRCACKVKRAATLYTRVAYRSERDGLLHMPYMESPEYAFCDDMGFVILPQAISYMWPLSLLGAPTPRLT